MLREVIEQLRPRRNDLFLRRAWLALVAPGMLVPRVAIALAVVLVPWLLPSVDVVPTARVVAAALVTAQVASTVAMQRRPGNRAAVVFAAVLAVDVVLCGVVLGSERHLSGVGLPMALIAVTLCFAIDGWIGAGLGALLVGAGSAAAASLPIHAPIIWPDSLVFGTTLSVETVYAGRPAVDATMLWFPTALHVETSFGGVSGLGWPAAVLLPVLALAVAALGLGTIVSLWGVRRVSVGALALLLLAASAARAQCDAAGRPTFIKGLEVLSHGDLPAATRAFYQLVQVDPSCAEARNNLAVLYVEQDRLDDAAKQLRRALELNPNYERARVNLARVEALLQERQARVVPSPLPTPSASAERVDVTPVASATPEATYGPDPTVAASLQAPLPSPTTPTAGGSTPSPSVPW